MNFENYLVYLAYTMVYLALAVALKHILNRKSSQYYTADDELKDGNMAVGLRRSGAQLGLAIAMLGVMSGNTQTDIFDDLINTSLYGLVAVAFMWFSLVVTDKAVLPKIDNTAELKKGNIAVGFVEFGTLLMTGILAYASIKGDEGGLLAGQVTLIILIIAYEKIISRTQNPLKEIANGNFSAGVILGGKIIAYGLILQSTIIGNGGDETLVNLAGEFIFGAISGMIFLFIFEYLIDLLIVTSSTVADIIKNDEKVLAIQLSLTKIGMALILGMAIL